MTVLAQEARGATALSLLVVDDSDIERELISLTLGEAFPEADIVTAAHPEAARNLCQARRFDCVLTDYNMPGLDGVELAGKIRAESTATPIVLMTSVGDEMLAAEALRRGVSDYIPKSRITSDSIRRAVDRSIHVASQARLIEEQRDELETFAYALAHDFKQPIRQITTFSQLIAQELGDPAGVGSVQQHLKFLGEAAGRLGKLVDVMSQYTLLNQPPELKAVDMGRVQASVRTSLAPYLAERIGALVLMDHPPMVRGNETLMTQVLQNLVINGLKYNESPKPRVELSARADSDHWIISVKDNGLGIETEYLAEIFKPLIRLHNASDYAGTGLGLTLARKAVIAQKGAIWCESEIGKGSVFNIRVPQAVERPRAD